LKYGKKVLAGNLHEKEQLMSVFMCCKRSYLV